jgi:hypothetical protein
VPPAGELGAEGDGREGVTGIAEGGEQDAAARGGAVAGPLGQSIPASSRTVRFLASGSKAMGETINVPTPASR